MAPTKAVLVIGHSYIRRWVKEYTVECSLPDVSPNYGIDSTAVCIDTVGYGGCKTTTITGRLAVAGTRVYHGAVIQLGGNDLCVTRNYDRIAAFLVSIAQYLQVSYGIDRIALCQVLRRPQFPYPDYNDLVVKLNDAILQRSRSLPGICMWKHRGFWRSKVNVQHADGIHLNTYGLYKYYKSIRGAIFKVLDDGDIWILMWVFLYPDICVVDINVDQLSNTFLCITLVNAVMKVSGMWLFLGEKVWNQPKCPEIQGF